MSFKNKRILVIHLDYCFENANTIIVERILHQLNQDYDVDIATYDVKGANHQYGSDLERIKTVKYYSLNRAMNTANLEIGDVLRICFCNIKEKITKSKFDEKNVYYFKKQLCKKIRISDYNLILSFSNPFSSHYAASLISKEYDIPWIAYYLDPFFTNATFDKNGLKMRKHLEERITGHAKTLYLTYPINEDYIENEFENRDLIRRIEMPGIRNEIHVSDTNQCGEIAQCYFVGNLYSDIRNPDSVISLFSKMGNVAELFFVGGFFGDIPMLTENSYANIHYLGKKSQGEIKEIYKTTDVLVNIGNLIINQIPSKIFEYISTGKPIINIYKTLKCPTLKYTKKYPLCLNIYEEDMISCPEKTVKIIDDFIRKTRGRYLSSQEINEMFWGNLDASVTKDLKSKIEEEI